MFFFKKRNFWELKKKIQKLDSGYDCQFETSGLEGEPGPEIITMPVYLIDLQRALEAEN